MLDMTCQMIRYNCIKSFPTAQACCRGLTQVYHAAKPCSAAACVVFIEKSCSGPATICMHALKTHLYGSTIFHYLCLSVHCTTQKVKQVVNLFARNGVTICPGKISGGAFNPQGTLLYLACESHNKVIVLDATATRQHRVLANFTTQAMPTDIAVDK